MTAVVLFAWAAITALILLLGAVHTWHPGSHPTATRCAAAAVSVVALLSMTLPRLR